MKADKDQEHLSSILYQNVLLCLPVSPWFPVLEKKNQIDPSSPSLCVFWRNKTRDWGISCRCSLAYAMMIEESSRCTAFKRNRVRGKEEASWGGSQIHTPFMFSLGSWASKSVEDSDEGEEVSVKLRDREIDMIEHEKTWSDFSTNERSQMTLWREDAFCLSLEKGSSLDTLMTSCLFRDVVVSILLMLLSCLCVWNHKKDLF